MRESFKKYWRDYAVAQKACNKFNKEHWFGTMVLSIVVGIATWGSLVAADKIAEKKRDKEIMEARNKVNDEE